MTVTSSNNQPTTVVYGTVITTSGAPPVTLTCSQASQTLFPIGTTMVSCTATDARQRTASCTFGVTVVAPPSISLTKFMAFGDSMTAGEDGFDAASAFTAPGRRQPLVIFPPSKTYPGVLELNLRSRYTTQTPTVANFGVPGERVADRATLSRFSALVGSGLYEAALIMEGANDLADRDDRITVVTVANLRQMLVYVKSRNVRPYLATIPPQVPGTRRGGLTWSMVQPFNDQVRALAASEGVTLVDVYQGIATDTNQYINADGEHLTEAGYAKVADVFFGALRATLERAPTLSFSPTAPGFFRRR